MKGFESGRDKKTAHVVSEKQQEEEKNPPSLREKE